MRLGMGKVGVNLSSKKLLVKSLFGNALCLCILTPMLIPHVKPTAALEKHAVMQSPSQLESLVKIFVHATKVLCLPFLLPSFPSFLLSLKYSSTKNTMLTRETRWKRASGIWAVHEDGGYGEHIFGKGVLGIVLSYGAVWMGMG